MAAIHPRAVIPGDGARSRNLPGSFNGFFAESRNSENDPIPVIRSGQVCSLSPFPPSMHGFQRKLAGEDE